MGITIKFLGASGTVTGSKYLLTIGSKRILVDSGMFQGSREWRERNWDEPPMDVSQIDAVLLTHAHIDHTGMLPRFYRLGLRCPVYATGATTDLCGLVLPDSGRLQEEEAEYREQRKKSRHHPALPLYTELDARGCLGLFKNVRFHEKVKILDGITAEWLRMGHILGAASIRLTAEGKQINFSGDIGRYSVPILEDPEPVEYGDLLLIESTYGDRLHDKVPPEEKLGEVVRETAARNGVVVIPSFAVGRTQEMLFYLRDLKSKGRIPDIPVIIDSPMAQDATSIYKKYPDCYDERARVLIEQGDHPFSMPRMRFIQDKRESIQLNGIHEPMVIISASGMLSGGRILHHLKHRIGDPRNTVLFVGFQPPGGRGDWIKSGATSMRLIGDEVPIRAHVAEISSLSAHADRDELLRWCREGKGKPGKVAVVHGEPTSAVSFSKTLNKEFSWNAQCPKYLEEWAV